MTKFAKKKNKKIKQKNVVQKLYVFFFAKKNLKLERAGGPKQYKRHKKKKNTQTEMNASFQFAKYFFLFQFFFPKSNNNNTPSSNALQLDFE